MTDAQRVDVERFDPCLLTETDDARLESITADMERATFGEYVKHEAYAALLLQVAELRQTLGMTQASLQSRNEQLAGCESALGDAWAKAEAAERAREEACGLLREAQPRVRHSAGSVAGAIGAHYATEDYALLSRIAAFLAANGAETTGARMRGVG